MKPKDEIMRQVRECEANILAAVKKFEEASGVYVADIDLMCAEVFGVPPKTDSVRVLIDPDSFRK